MPPLAAGRILWGATIRGGVCCHRGRPAASVPYSVALDGVVLENAHAEVRTMHVFDVCEGRSDDEAVETSDRSGRLEAIAILPRAG